MKTIHAFVLFVAFWPLSSECIGDERSKSALKGEIESTIRLEANSQAGMSSLALAGKIDHARVGSIYLADAWAEIEPEYWVSDIAGSAVIESFLWPAANLATVMQGIPRRSSKALAISAADAVATLDAVYAFREMLRRMDPLVWTMLTNRASKAGDLLDLCLMTQITWGNSLRLLPSDAAPNSSRMSANTPLPQPAMSADWSLPHGTPDQWKMLSTGSNAVFRLLALKGLDLWASTNELPSLLRGALNDPYISIRDEGLSGIQRLSPVDQVRLLEEYAQREQARVPTTEAEREATKWLNGRVAKKLTALRAVAPSASSPGK